MNLMDVRTRRWDPRLLELCGGPELRDKLGEEPVNGGAVLGNISQYWQKKWGFREGRLYDEPCENGFVRFFPQYITPNYPQTALSRPSRATIRLPSLP